MYLVDNPVLQRELLSNLRMSRAFVLLFFYLALLGAIVLIQWPSSEDVNLLDSAISRNLINAFFLGQYLLSCLMVPAFAAAAFSGEKEKKTFEMLVASPLRPTAISLGKLLGALAQVALLIFCSLPIVVLCLPLGGTSLYEVLAAYVMLLVSIATFAMITLFCSSYFRRTAAALIVSYLLILPLALLGVFFWVGLQATAAELRLVASVTVFPLAAVVFCAAMLRLVSGRLLHPPDMGSEGKEVVDEETELREAVGMVIYRGQFPDNLFAPAMRNDLLNDGVNPMFDKEMRHEIFSQGTLMLRVVIQVSMLLAVPLMAWFLYLQPERAGWYVAYILLFNLLVGPVFSAGSITSERERETLELLLTTVLTPWQILSAKLISGLRVSSVLTLFLAWPLLLACLMVHQYWSNLPAFAAYLVLILLCCLTTATIALCCSVAFQKTTSSLMYTYVVLMLLFAAPIAAAELLESSMPNHPMTQAVSFFEFTSPFAVATSIPLSIESVDAAAQAEGAGEDFWMFWRFVVFYVATNAALLTSMSWWFHRRWRVA